MKAAVKSQLDVHIASHIPKQPTRHIDATEALVSSGLLDSFSQVDLALFMKDAFAVHIDETEPNSATFDTLEQPVAVIEGKRAQ